MTMTATTDRSDTEVVIVPRAARYPVIEKRPYRVHQRIVPRDGVDRIRLAGDADPRHRGCGGTKRASREQLAS